MKSSIHPDTRCEVRGPPLPVCWCWRSVAGRTLELMSGAMATARRPETRTALVRRARKINRVLAETYPDAHCELDFQNPFQLLVATVLSAQTTDKRANLTTPVLFAKYPTP